MSLWQKSSPEPMENSSGYVSNSNSMNPPVKYATIGRRQPGGVKRTSSLLVPQPQPPSSYKANPIPKPKRSLLSAKDARRPLKNELSRPSSRASKSSFNSGSGLGMGLGRPTSRSSRDAPSGKLSSRRSGPRASHHKLRRPESRASSKALILRRRESTRRGKSSSSAGPSSVRQSSRGGSRPSSRGAPSTSGGQRRSPAAAATTSKSSFFSWKPKLTLKRSKSMQAKKDSSGSKREIRFGDDGLPGVIMMRGVERRRPEGGPLPLRRPDNRDIPDGPVSSQTLPRPPRHAPSPERAARTQRAASVDLLERRAAAAAGDRERRSGSPSLASRRSRERERERTRSSRSVSPFKVRPPSELSSSPAPRAPIWRADSDGSLTETVTNLSVLTESREERARPGGLRSQRPPGRSAGRSAPKASDKSTVMDFIRRKLSIKPKEKPTPVRVQSSSGHRRRERASSSSSSPDRPRPSGRLRSAKSIDVLTAEERPPMPSQDDEKRYMSLPRGKRRSSGTTLSRKLSNMGWSTLGRAPAGRDRQPSSVRDPRDPRDPSGRHANSLREGRSNVLPHIMPEPGRPAPGLPRSLSQPGPAGEPDRSPELPPPPPPEFDGDPEPPVPPKLDTSSLRRRPVSPQDEEPIQPILQDRRAISQSQPSLLAPREEPDAPEEPFTLYANLPFQLPVRLPGSPEPGQRAANAASLKAKRAMSQPSLLEPPPPPAGPPRPPSPPRRSPPRSSADRSDTIYAYSPHQRGRPPPPQQRPQTRTVWRPTITVKRKGILKGRKGEGEAGAPPQRRQQGVLHDIANNIRSVFKHKKNPDERGVPEGYVAVPGGAVVSERFTNITNTHEERDDVREEEEVHHLGQYSNEEISRAIRDGRDARALVRQRQGSGPSGQLVDPRNGQRRVVHQAGKTWRTVDTEDIHEKTRQDEHGELVTETARTAQQEQFQNITVPEDGSDCSAEEQHRTTSRHRRHVKDEDMLEYYSVPKGGRLGDGIKLGEGLRYVQENVEEDREGDDNIESLSERMRRLRQLGYKPEGQTLAKTPIEYQEEEKTRRKETHKWLDSHFGSESGQSGSSEDGESRRRVQGRDEVDRPQAGAYEFQTTSARRADQTQTGTWQRSEQYSKQVRQTPEHTYVKETRQTPRGEFERVQMTPVGASPGPRRSSLVSTDTRGESEDPIFASKFSSGKPRGNVRFQAASPERRPVDSGRLSPPTQSPPPPPPPRHRRKGRDKESPLNVPNDNHYASSPIRERYERDSRNGIGSDERRSERRQVKEYHFGSGSPRSSDRDRGGSSSRFEQRESSRHGSYSDDRDGSLRRHGVETSRGRTASIDELSSSRQSDAERRVRYHHRSTDFLDRRGSEERRAPPERVTFESRTLPRRPHEHAASPVTRAPDAGRFGGSMINVSLRSAGRGAAPQKPARSPIQRSNSLYSKDGQDGAFNAGLKSPDIISKIQRTASMRRGDGGEAAPEQERMSHTSSSSRSYRASPAAPPQPPGKKDSFMRGLLKNAPELYSVLHGNERKDSKTPSPRSGLITPPPPLERVTPAGGSALSRSERLRSEDSRSGRSYTPSDDAYRGGADRPSIVKVNVRHSAEREREGSPRSARLVNGVSAGATAHPADTPIHYRYNDEIYTSPSRRDEIYTSPSRRGEWSEERSTSERSREDRPGGGRHRETSPSPESPLVARVRAWHRASAAAPT